MKAFTLSRDEARRILKQLGHGSVEDLTDLKLERSLRAYATIEQPKGKRGRKLGSGYGVWLAIITALRGASRRKPLTREQVHAKVCAEFPDRDPAKLRTTVWALTYRIPKRYGLNLQRSREGFWIEGS